MIGNLGWALIAVAAAVVQVEALRPTSRFVRLGELGARLGRGWIGQLLLLAIWWFAGVHFFSRLGVKH